MIFCIVLFRKTHKKNRKRAITNQKSDSPFALKFIFYCTSAPKGTKDSCISLKHCLPKGMPIMVMQSRTPQINHATADQKPVKRNQRMLPIVFIFVSSIHFVASLYTNSEEKSSISPHDKRATTVALLIS